ncbi:MAG: MFS transporter [Acidimicrobiales bacterium]
MNKGLRSLFSLRGRYRVLHATTFAFFLSFVVWFNFAPFAGAIGKDLGLTKAQLATIGICNLALTVPARLFVGMLLDRFGPRRLYAGLLVMAVVPNTVFALAHSFPVLVGARLAVGLVGAGFVVGIRMVSEWFESEDMGTAEGIYGGWGNFGSAAAALALPTIATAIAGGPGAWRWGVGVSGAVAAVYGLIYLFLVADTPDGMTYLRPRRQGALEVTSRPAVFGLALLQLPVVGVLALVALRVERAGVIDEGALQATWALLGVFGVFLVATVLRVNRAALRNEYPPSERYAFLPVVILSLAYFVTFGAELAVISLLPTFFADTFGLTVAAAGAAGSAFAFTNLVTRPGGGVLSDRLPHRRRTLGALLVGTAVSFLVMTQLSAAWPVAAGIALVALASVFVQGGNGAVFAMVPLVRRQVGGQIAGIAGSYGNVGGITFSLLLFFTVDAAHPGGDTRLLFLTIAVCAAVAAGLCRLLPDFESDAAEVTAEAERIAAAAAEEHIR